MKKYILLVLIFMGFLGFGQGSGISTALPSLTFPHPAANGLMNMGINPVNTYTGIPDISIPLYNLKTSSDKVGVDVALSYHPSSVSLLNKVGDVGMGWNINGIGSISKIVQKDPDFRNNPNIVSTSDDDVFVYNFMGQSGRFRIAKNTSTNAYELVQLTPTRLKFEFSMNNEASNPNGIRFDETNYFNVYDENGYKYVFDVYDLKMAIFYLSTQPQAGNTNWVDPNVASPRVGGLYRSTYHLKRIIDPNNKTILEMDYTAYSMPISMNSSTTAVEVEYKISSVNAFGFGKVDFNYTYLGNNSRLFIVNPNSNFTLNSIEVKDFLNNRIKKYEFVYGNHTTAYNYYSYTTTTLNRRILTQLKEYNNTLSSFESTFFEYNHPAYNPTSYSACNKMDYGRDAWGYLNLKNKDFPVVEDDNYPNDVLPYGHKALEHTEPSLVTTGVLSKIIYPTGGSTLYQFESNTGESNLFNLGAGLTYPFFEDFGAAAFNPFNETIQDFLVQNYNTSSLNTITFTVPGTGTAPKCYLFNFTHNPYYSLANVDPNQALYGTCVITGPNFYSYNFEASYFTIGQNIEYQCHGKRLDLLPGTYTITISTFAGSTATGNITIKQKAPVLPQQEFRYGRGMRIKKIATYTTAAPNDIDYITWDDELVSYREYDYTVFGFPNKSSNTYNECGDYKIQFGRTLEEDFGSGGYLNIKVLHGRNQVNGYEKFTYMSCSDFPITPTNGKIYRTLATQLNNGLMKKHEVFTALGEKRKEVSYTYDALIDSNFYTFVYPSAITNDSYFYSAGSSVPKIVSTNETFIYNVANKKVAESVLTASDLSQLKKKYYYHTGNSIHTQNRISELEKVETYNGNNLLSTSTIAYSTTFATNVSQLPATVATSKENGTLENRVRYVQYDDLSNPLQVQQENGTPTSYIWGYNKSVPVAKLENVAYSAISSATIGLIQTKSNSANSEAELIDLLNGLRTALPTAMITTYTYKPMVGISTVTDVKGDRMTYIYDSFNRLKEVRDKANNILSETDYYYRANPNEKNYIKSKTYKVPTTTTLATPSITQANQGITYFDGLGRTIQSIANAQSGTGKDIISHVEYDALGRQVRQYLPFASTQTSMAFVDPIVLKQSILNYYQTTYGDSNPYSEKLLENSPLNRVLEQAAPGNDWSLTNAEKHTIRFEYQSNGASEVKLFKATSSLTPGTGMYTSNFVNGSGTVFYPANTLVKSIVKNENWKTGDGSKNTTEEFKDKEGKLIMKRVFATSVVNEVETAVWHETYNVYDQFGNLSFVLPPNADGAITTAILNDLCYQYRYDHRNRLIEKKEPGKQDQFIVYDKLDRIVATGPALCPFTNNLGTGWMITKYDVFSRPILTAWLPGASTSAARKTMQDNYTAATALFETKPATNSTISGVTFRYSNTVLPTTSYHVMTVNYYDDYTSNLLFTVPPAYTAINGQTLLNNTAGNTPRGLPTMSWVRVCETSALIANDRSYMLYDTKGRVIRTFKNNYLGGYTLMDSQLQTITGRVNVTEIKQKRLNADLELYVKNVFTYTAQDRLLSQTHQIGTAGVPQLIAKNDYNPLGELVSKQVGGTDVTTFVGLQKVDYSYNIRGWLKGINDVSNLTPSSSPTDLFAFKINYNEVQDETNYTGTKLYNGNISETYWRTSNDNVQRKYGYQYDEMNRLKNAVYQKPETAVRVTNSYNESMTYDKNGNIKKLQRTGEFDDASLSFLIDDLVYTYDAAKQNQLNKVIDQSSVPAGFKDSTLNTLDDYTYDNNGNMLTDNNKNISQIVYNHLNLPIKISFGTSGSTGIIEYIYNAVGSKVQKKVTAGGVLTITDYLDGYQYEKVASAAVKLLFFPHAEGYVSHTAGSYNYVFNYTDHLGNIRLSYTFDVASSALKILEENNYYPYGMKQNNYNWSKKYYDKVVNGLIFIGEVPALPYKYKYNGKEYQDELGLNMTAMDMRMFDSAIARWVVQDPVIHHNQSMYNGYDGNPVYFADPSGADVILSDIGLTLTGEDARNFFGSYAKTAGSHQDSSFQFEMSGSGYDFRDTDEGGVIDFFLLNGRNVSDAQGNYREDDIVNELSKIYKLLKGIGIKDPNSNAVVGYDSVLKVLTSSFLQNSEVIKMIGNPQFSAKDDGTIQIDFESRSLKWYGNIDDKTKIIYINGYTAFTTWARLAMTLLHELGHLKELNNKLWIPGSIGTTSTRASERRMWLQNKSLGDVIWEQMYNRYK